MRKLIALFLTLLLMGSMLISVYAESGSKGSGTERHAPKIEAMISWALKTARDNSHGYSQTKRHGPNYDCTSFVSRALMEGGFALDHYLSTSGMIAELPGLGFKLYRKGEVTPRRGDILVQLGVHAEICMGNGDCVAAHNDYDGRSGDGSGHEIEYRSADDVFNCEFCKYRQYNYILRYPTPRKTESKSESTSGKKSGQKTESESKTKSETKTKSESKSKSETKTKSESKSQSETKTKSESKTQSETKTKSESKSKSEVKTKSESKAKSETKTKSESKTKSEAKTKSETKTKSGTKAKTKTEAKPETKQKAEKAASGNNGTESKRKRVGKAAAAPELSVYVRPELPKGRLPLLEIQ